MISIYQLLKSRWRFASANKLAYIGWLIITTTVFQAILYLTFNRNSTAICRLDNWKPSQSRTSLFTIYAITPTYRRHVQIAELTRLSHTFMLVPKLHWIIVEDSPNTTELVEVFVNKLKNKYNFYNVTLLFAPTPVEFKRKPNDPAWKYPKGVWQRNRALHWIRENLDGLGTQGILYFADDDNTYDLELFNEMRATLKVSVWPVGLAGNLIVEKPLVQGGKVKSFNSIWSKDRPYPIDMAGFAVNLNYYLSRGNATFSYSEPIGHLESHFLGQLVNGWDELEPKANECRDVLVWHTKTRNPRVRPMKKLLVSTDNKDL